MEKSESLGPNLSARSFMGLFRGTSRAVTLNYDETFCRKLFCAPVTSGTSRSARTYLYTSCVSFPLFWLHGKEAISEAVSRCILLVFLEVKLPHAHFFPSASHFHVLFSFNSTFRFAILSFFNSAETFHFAFRHFCLHSCPSK